MSNISDLNYLSAYDSRRLKKYFFSPSGDNDNGKRTKKEKMIPAVILLVTLGIIAIFISRNFNIVILPQYAKKIAKEEAIDLITNKNLAALKLIKPEQGSKIAEEVVFMNIPFDKKSGFSLNLKNKVNIIDSRLILVVKNPHQDFELYTTLRDVSFFSNARDPIKLKISQYAKDLTYLEIPIEITRKATSNFNAAYTNQIRFVFRQNKKDFMPIFVKNVLLERKDTP